MQLLKPAQALLNFDSQSPFAVSILDANSASVDCKRPLRWHSPCQSQARIKEEGLSDVCRCPDSKRKRRL